MADGGQKLTVSNQLTAWKKTLHKNDQYTDQHKVKRLFIYTTVSCSLNAGVSYRLSRRLNPLNSLFGVQNVFVTEILPKLSFEGKGF